MDFLFLLYPVYAVSYVSVVWLCFHKLMITIALPLITGSANGSHLSDMFGAVTRIWQSSLQQCRCILKSTLMEYSPQSCWFTSSHLLQVLSASQSYLMHACMTVRASKLIGNDNTGAQWTSAHIGIYVQYVTFEEEASWQTKVWYW